MIVIGVSIQWEEWIKPTICDNHSSPKPEFCSSGPPPVDDDDDSPPTACETLGRGQCRRNPDCEWIRSTSECVPSVVDDDIDDDDTTTCIQCDDTPSGKMISQGMTCADISNLDERCAKDKFISNKYCQLSCYNSGNGYDGDVCCNGDVL